MQEVESKKNTILQNLRLDNAILVQDVACAIEQNFSLKEEIEQTRAINSKENFENKILKIIVLSTFLAATCYFIWKLLQNESIVVNVQVEK